MSVRSGRRTTAVCRLRYVAASPHPDYTPTASTDTIYSYVDCPQTEPYWTIAQQFTLGDHFFVGQNSESYTAHQLLFSAQSNKVASAPDYHKGSWYCGALYLGGADTPWGCDPPTGTTTSLIDEQGMVKPDGPRSILPKAKPNSTSRWLRMED